MNPLWIAQIKAVIRLELRKTFFARRGLWIYLLALAPVAMFTMQALIEMRVKGENPVADGRRISDQELSLIHPGMTAEEVIARLGQPASTSTSSHPGGRTGKKYKFDF